VTDAVAADLAAANLAAANGKLGMLEQEFMPMITMNGDQSWPAVLPVNGTGEPASARGPVTVNVAQDSLSSSATGPGYGDALSDSHKVPRRLDLQRFEVQLSKDGAASFGLAHVPMEDGSGTLLIVDWKESGPIGRWNAEKLELGLPECALKRGDRVVCVNGSTADIDGMRRLLREDTVHFTVERWPETINVLLQKRTTADKYGMQTDLLRKDDGEQVLVVRQIWGGLLGEWNQWACLSRRFFETVSPGSDSSVNVMSI
jgi:hypothetical protein